MITRYARVSLIGIVAVLTLANVSAGATGTMLAAEPGDTFSIGGTDFQCGVPAAGPGTIVCYLGTTTTARDHSYAFTALDAGVTLFEPTGSQQVVAKDDNPALSGSAQGAPSHKPAHYTISRSQHLAVIGSHIQCNSGTDPSGDPTFACESFTASEHIYAVPGTYITVISDKGAYILLAGKDGSHTTVAFEKQP